MNPAEFSVKNSLFVNLFAVFLMVAGLAATFAMNREAFPNFSFDIVVVQTLYPGAPPEQVEKLVTIPIEKEIRSLDYIDEINSVSTENISVITVTIDPDAPNVDDVVTKIQQEVNSIRDLPADVEDPLVQEITAGNTPVIEVNLGGWVEESLLQRYALILEDRLLELPGISAVSRRGWRNREIQIEVDPERMLGSHIALDEIVNALAQHNVNVPAGEALLNGREVLIRTDGEFFTAEEVEQVIVRSSDVGNWVKVGDVATVYDTFEDTDVLLRAKGKPTISLVVIKKEAGDTIEIVDLINKKLDQFRTELPEEIEISIANDISFYVKRRLKVLLNNGWIGLSLVLIVLFLFLGRTVALMTALGLPLAMMTALLLMYLFGATINLITMFAMIMVLGLVVDDAIIVSENVHRHLEMGKSPKQAAIDGTAEVAKPVVATVLTSVSAFIPLLFMSGIFGKFIWWMPVVVTIVLTASLLECLFVLPTHLADFVHPQTNHKHRSESRWFQTIQDTYVYILQSALRLRYLLWGLFFTLLVGAFLLAKSVVPFVLFPHEGIEAFIIRGETPVGTPLQATSEYMKPIEAILDRLPKEDLDTYLTQIGIQQQEADDPGTQRGTHLGQVMVYLTPAQGRKRTADDVIEELREKVKDLPGWERLYFERINPGPPTGKPVAVRIQGDHFETLERIAREYEARLKQMPGVADVRIDFERGKLQRRVAVDRESASISGLTTADIARTVRTAYEGATATEIKPLRAEEAVDVIVRLPEKDRNDPATFDKLLIRNRNDLLVPLNKVASWTEEPGLSFIKRRDGKRVITVSADVDGKTATSVRINTALAKEFSDVEQRYLGYTVTYGGEQEDTNESLDSLFRAFGLAALLIFFLLATNFQSLHQPLIVMLTIPFAIVGVILTFFIHGKPLSFLAILGLIGLCGVVVNDSIILVNFINQLRLEGHQRRESIISAGKLRLRQVLLTTITTCFGLFPVAYGWGGSDPFLKPMALAISWGLAFSTVLTLILVPATYAMVDDAAAWVRRVTHRPPGPLNGHH
ncbi:MAG: efflux RND transporter permease subunit [Candidatus Omnitrophica bacterium]|nr:efflux RND transporter permease subunit [Candidatus Omnitrophota bacterium]